MRAMDDAREALEAIFQDEFEAQENTHEGTAQWKISLRELGVVVIADLTEDYPGEVPPNLRLEFDSWPVDGDTFVQNLLVTAAELYQPGECCIFNCVEHIKEALHQDPFALVAGSVHTTSVTEPQEVQQVLQDGIVDDDYVEELGGPVLEYQTYNSRKKEAELEKRQIPKMPAELCTQDASGEKLKLGGSGAIRERLKRGETVCRLFPRNANSMTPRIKAGQMCTYAPVLTHDDVNLDDVVMCKVSGRHYPGHLVCQKKLVRRGTNGEPDEFQYQISNNHGHINGWTSLDRIYGRIVEK
eukprot:TRINITY_DN17469_c0_g1_i3.p1 TRINITY_DN17469_c0_g1~~TRINITY_DN17469_c0_g1_i3.p1  ORF type:complete len:299 (-),score=48.19 TRINITY_DN17469_c0_g1_i3:64-960(-)